MERMRNELPTDESNPVGPSEAMAGQEGQIAAAPAPQGELPKGRFCEGPSRSHSPWGRAGRTAIDLPERTKQQIQCNPPVWGIVARKFTRYGLVVALLYGEFGRGIWSCFACGPVWFVSSDNVKGGNG